MKIVIDKKCQNKIMDFFGEKKKECAGVIGINDNGVITEFEPDIAPILSSKSCYIPNANNLEKIINILWNKKDVNFAGFIHLHLYNNEISEEDIVFFKELKRINHMDKIFCGIYFNKNIKWYTI